MITFAHVLFENNDSEVRRSQFPQFKVMYCGNLLAILLVVGQISLLHAYSGMNIYKMWPLNVLEFTTYFSILAYAAVKFYIQMVGAGGNHAYCYCIYILQYPVYDLCALIISPLHARISYSRQGQAEQVV